MYEKIYLKRRRRRIAAAIIGGIGTTGVATLSIAAFLGHRVGSFTVSLEAKSVELTLSEKSDFKERTSFLRLNEVPEFQEFAYCDFERNYGDQVIDSEDTDYTLGENKNNKLNFLKYTFFVKNVGDDPAKYDLSLVIKENIPSDDGRSLEDTMRVMVYTDGVPEVYAKWLSNPRKDANGELDYRAPISVDEDKASPEYPFEGYAKTFVSQTEVMNQKEKVLESGEYRKYTVVFWLEGFRSSNDLTAPSGASIKLGVEINAYENE